MSRFLISFLAALLLPAPLSSFAAGPAYLRAGRPRFQQTLTVLRGRAVCLDAAGREVDSLLGCNESGRRFGLASKDGRLYKFSATDAMTEMFTDIRVRQRELQISARLLAGDRLEIIKVQSIKEGKLYDIFYFCELCNIKAYAPGLCPCCRNDLEFRETPQ